MTILMPDNEEARIAAVVVPTHPDTLLRRQQAADALTAAGYKITASTLATKAVRGGGPLYRTWGNVPVYRWGDLTAWAQGRMSEPRRNTSGARRGLVRGLVTKGG